MIQSWLNELSPKLGAVWPQALTVGVVVLVLLTLALGRVSTDLVMLAGLVIIVVGGALPAKQALEGFGNEGLVTIAALYVVTAGVRETAALTGITDAILGKPRSVTGAQARMIFPLAAISAF